MFLWNIAVTSLVEVWIEMLMVMRQDEVHAVTSLVEVWIEIVHHIAMPKVFYVTSLVEVWIEMALSISETLEIASHFPCGSVD